MPGMSGNAATRAIRAREGDDRHTPIIALTAKVMEHDQKKAFDAGVDDFLSKPVFIEDIAAALQRVLYNSTSGRLLEAVDSVGARRELTGEEVLDTTIIEELKKIGHSSNSDLFSDLADQFLRRVPAWIRELEAAARDNDLPTVRRQAHRLLGLCRQIGAERMAAQCDRLEKIDAEAADSESAVVTAVALLQREFQAAYRELDNRHLSD